MLRRHFLQLTALAFILVSTCAGVQFQKFKAWGSRQQIVKKPEYIKLLLQALDERDDPNDNSTEPFLKELRLKIIDNSQNAVEIKFGPNKENRVGMSILNLVADTLENALKEAEQLSYPLKLCELSQNCT